MRYISFADSDTYPVALLIKASAFAKHEIQNAYITPMVKAGIPAEEVVAMTAEYNEAGKAPVKFIKAYLEELLPALDAVGTQVVYCADAAYFKQLTGAKKAEPHLGSFLDCKIKGYEHMKVFLGINHKSLIYHAANEAKLDLSLSALCSYYTGGYKELGKDIIHKASYPMDPEHIRLALQELHQYDALSCDIEGFSLDFEKAGIATITFCWSQHEGIAFSVDYVELSGGPTDEGLYGMMIPNAEVRDLLQQFFESYAGNLRWHGSTYDLEVLIYELWMVDLLDTPGLLKGLEIMTRDFHDTKTIAYLAVNSTAGNKLSLKELAHEFAGNWAQEDIKDVRKIPLSDLLEYNLIDGLATNYVFDKYYPIMVADQQEELYYELMRPSLKTIMQMEMTGMPLSPDGVKSARKELEKITDEHKATLAKFRGGIIGELEKRLQVQAMEAANEKLKIKQHPLSAFAHVRFNPNSGQQKQKLLYEVMELPILDRTKAKQPATKSDTLEKLINHTSDPVHHEILNALMGLAAAEKILSSFIPAFEAAIDKGTGVVWLHGNFNLGGTVSGRLSSSDPNLQNIPSGSTYGKLIKRCFMAPFGFLFGGADFNSLEDYISALTTKDPNKLKVYIEGYDGHSLRAYNYWPEKFPDLDPTPESVNQIKKLYPKIRQDSKAPTFALTYQGTWHTLVKNCGFPKKEAQKIEANYHEMYKVSDQWVQDKLDQAAKDGFVTVAFGLRVRTPLLSQTFRKHRTTPYEAEAEGRTAGNALGQSYGLLTNRAANAFMERVWASPYRFDILPIAMIHDAIYLLMKDDVHVVEWVNRVLIEEMQWQELPEIQHDTVKIGAALDIFWPTWADEMGIPNGADAETIRELAKAHAREIQSKQKEAA